MRYTVGVDVGGTNIKLGLVNPKGEIIDRSYLVTKAFSRDRKKLIHALLGNIHDLIRSNNLFKKEIQGIGLGLPGLINPYRGVINFLPNIPGWRNVPLKKIIEKKIGIKTFLENDVHLITLAEWKWGAGRGYQNLICMTLGTGVGAGLILNNELYRGEGFVAGELGHMPLNETGPKCNCGGHGCFERYVGNTVLFKKAEKIFRKKGMVTQDVFRLASRGNKKAVLFWREVGEQVGNGLVGVVNLLNPRLIIIGGGVSNNFKFFKDALRQTLQKRAMKVQASMVKIVRAQLGDDAGIMGAQVLVKGFLS